MPKSFETWLQVVVGESEPITLYLGIDLPFAPHPQLIVRDKQLRYAIDECEYLLDEAYFQCPCRVFDDAGSLVVDARVLEAAGWFEEQDWEAEEPLAPAANVAAPAQDSPAPAPAPQSPPAPRADLRTSRTIMLGRLFDRVKARRQLM
jgi:hypothetical protein